MVLCVCQAVLRMNPAMTREERYERVEEVINQVWLLELFTYTARTRLMILLLCFLHSLHMCGCCYCHSPISLSVASVNQITNHSSLQSFIVYSYQYDDSGTSLCRHLCKADTSSLRTVFFQSQTQTKSGSLRVRTGFGKVLEKFWNFKNLIPGPGKVWYLEFGFGKVLDFLKSIVKRHALYSTCTAF